MRSTCSIVLSILLGCAPERLAPPADDPGGEPPVAIVPVSGVTYDSVTGQPSPGVHVEFGGKVLFTDSEGRFTANAAEGPVRVQVTHPDYETIDRLITIPPVQVALPLRRMAPLPYACRINDGVFTAIVLDLQGRKSLERWSRSSLTLWTPAGSRTISATNLGYSPIDMYRWALEIPDAGPVVLRADWHLFDSELHEYVGSCVPVIGGGVPDSIA